MNRIILQYVKVNHFSDWTMQSSTRISKKNFLVHFQINAKYNEQHAHEVLDWIAHITGEPISISGDMDNLYETLKDGTILCK